MQIRSSQLEEQLLLVFLYKPTTEDKSTVEAELSQALLQLNTEDRQRDAHAPRELIFAKENEKENIPINLLGHSSVTDTTRTAQLHHSLPAKRACPTLAVASICVSCPGSVLPDLIPGSFWVRRWQQISVSPVQIRGVTLSPRRSV